MALKMRYGKADPGRHGSWAAVGRDRDTQGLSGFLTGGPGSGGAGGALLQVLRDVRCRTINVVANQVLFSPSMTLRGTGGR